MQSGLRFPSRSSLRFPQTRSIWPERVDRVRFRAEGKISAASFNADLPSGRLRISACHPHQMSGSKAAMAALGRFLPNCPTSSNARFFHS
jgi:hypothetical protein